LESVSRTRPLSQACDSLRPDASAARSGGSQLGDVQRANDGGATHTDTENQTTGDELAKGEGRGHDDGTGGEADMSTLSHGSLVPSQEIGNEQAHLASPGVRKVAQDRGT
jgi:hypothetical protein